jgi:putative hemolysin
MRMIRGAVRIATALVLCGAAYTAAAQTAKATKPTASGTKEAYCASTGGLVENRHAVYGTNNAFQNWLPLAGEQGFCQYTLADDGSRIHISLQTLFTAKPTLAALAYYSKVQWDGNGNGNPASFYCTQLGGSDLFGGVSLAGGGWVTTGGIDNVLEACVFPDNSTIDSWGLLYHSADIIRGIDLSTVLKFANPFPATKK